MIFPMTGYELGFNEVSSVGSARATNSDPRGARPMTYINEVKQVRTLTREHTCSSATADTAVEPSELLQDLAFKEKSES